MEPPASRSHMARNRWLFLGLLLVLICLLVALYLWLMPGLTDQPVLQMLPVSLHSLLKANYAKDPMTNAIPPMQLSLIGNALSDSGNATDVPGQVDTFINSLKTPVILSTLPGGTAAPAPTLTQPAVVSPTPTLLSSATPPVTVSPTGSVSLTVTLTQTFTEAPGLPTVTRPVILPTNTQPPAPTQKPLPSNTPVPRTSTSVPNTPTAPPPTPTLIDTVTSRPPTIVPTATRLPYPPPPTQPAPTSIYP
jgi:hypothetical protein